MSSYHDSKIVRRKSYENIITTILFWYGVTAGWNYVEDKLEGTNID